MTQMALVAASTRELGVQYSEEVLLVVQFGSLALEQKQTLGSTLS